MLAHWAQAVERYWTEVDDPSRSELGMGCYGPGYVHWGIQSNWNYAATMATLAAQPGVQRADHWRDRALGALRFALSTHLSGGRYGLNGDQPRTLSDVGEELGITRERVRQIESRALGQLRHPSTAFDLHSLL